MCMRKFRISDKEMCPCGSGILFKDCCKNKDIVQKELSKVPPDVQIMKKMRSSMKKCCMHPDKSRCNKKIKAAHALQNNKIINILGGTDRHVYMLDAKKQPLLVPLDDRKVIPYIQISKTSVNDATTENCFCDYHDNVAFAVIEKGAPDFDDSRVDMKFIYAYKAFIFEYYKQWIAMDIFRTNFKDNPKAFMSPDMVAMYRMLQLKQKEFEPVKKHFDSQIMAGTYNGIYTCSIRIPEQIAFADYAYIAPNYDMNGKKIMHTRKGVMHRIALTIFPEKTQSWLLMSCLESEKEIFEKFFWQMQHASYDKLKYYINLILPLYSENMVLGNALWNSWSSDNQMAYTYYANLNGPDAMVMEKALCFALKNAARSKSVDAYSANMKLNLFEQV